MFKKLILLIHNLSNRKYENIFVIVSSNPLIIEIFKSPLIINTITVVIIQANILYIMDLINNNKFSEITIFFFSFHREFCISIY